MKALAFIAAIVLLPLSLLAQQTQTNAPVRIPASAAKQHLNADAIVFGKVAEVNKAERLIRLNFDKPFPNQTFTAVIFANKTNLFPEIDQLKDKTVEIAGKIADYRGRPEIILTSTNQVKLLDKPADAKESAPK